MGATQLVSCSEITPGQIGVRRSPHIYANVKSSRRKEFEEEGWAFIPSKLKKAVRMKKTKPHFDAFEDRVWALFAKMRFPYMNQDNQFQLQYKQGLCKKIDVFAGGPESIVVVECKSSEKRRRGSYQKDINELISMKDGLRRSAQELFKGKPKVAFIFATNNSVLSDGDRKRLSADSIFHFTEADIEYFEQLTDHLGPAAKYQLCGKLFSGQKIPGLLNKVPAIKGKMASGRTFYSFSVEPELLLQVGYVLHRTETDAESSQAYQRLLKRKRIDEIGRYIDEGGYFPNSVIVNISTKREKELVFDQASSIEHDSATSLGVLHLPQVYRSVFIIDGQHRLYGHSKTKSTSHHTIPVVAFHNLPQEEQAQIFIDINHKQESVPANLLRSLMADFHWQSEDAGAAIGALKTRLLNEMNADDNSPFYKRIIMAQEPKTDTRCLTLETLLKWGLSSKLGFFGKVKGKTLVKHGYLTDVDYDATLKKSLCFFNSCFGYVEGKLPDQWEAGSGLGGFICMNIGVSAIMRTLDRVLDDLVRFKKLTPEEMNGEELANQVIPYLDPVVDFVKNLDSDGLKKLRSLFGSGATEKVLMEFLYAINQDYEDFNPEGLAEWIRDRAGEYTQLAWDLGHNRIEPMIHDFITAQLTKEYGEKYWWIEGVPKDIQKGCSDARIDIGTGEPDWHFLSTIHYEKMLLKNWQLLGMYFTPPGQESIKREKRLSWLNRLNSIRQKYSHPQREIVTEEEYEFLEELHGWLIEKLAI